MAEQHKKEEEEKDDDDDWEDDDNDDGWEEICSSRPITTLMDPPWPTGTYYEMFGGGPEGGYFVMPDGTVYSVSRTWFEPFIPRKLEGARLIFKTDSQDIRYCKLEYE